MSISACLLSTGPQAPALCLCANIPIFHRNEGQIEHSPALTPNTLDSVVHFLVYERASHYMQ